VGWLRERDELTKEKDNFRRGKEELIRECAELERAMQKLEGATGKECVPHHLVDQDAGGVVPGGGHHTAGCTARVHTTRLVVVDAAAGREEQDRIRYFAAGQ
jgi:hypothetical protein